jgi:hypothetical protein
MPNTKSWKKKLLKWATIALIAAPAAAIAGLTAQGLTAQGLTAQGLTAQGLTAQGLTAQGLTAQGLTAQGLTAQGLTAQGLTAQGLTAQGLTAQGLTAQGLTAQGLTAQGADLMGSDLGSGDLEGVAIGSVDLRGTTANSPLASYELTSIPGVSTGMGNYIVVGGGQSAVGHYAVAHLIDVHGAPAEDLDLYIADQQADTFSNQFHRADEQDNQDELYIVYFFQRVSGQWSSLCPYNGLTQSASAMAIPEDPTQPNKFIFACTATGVASKCARNWGFRPWAHTSAWLFDGTNWVLEDQDLKPYYDVCKGAAMAGYCQDGQSFTKAGTLVDLFDTRQIIWPNAIQNPFNGSNPDSLWMMAQEYFISTGVAGALPPQSSLQASALQRTRYRELSPVGECDSFAYVDRLERDNIEDGRWASPLTNTPRIQVFSPTYCTHDEATPGLASLPWDCSPCTTQVCKTMPQCCGGGGSTTWDATCVAQAAAVCQDGVTPWPHGKVWPAAAPTSAVVAKYLLGPGGAVLRTDGVSGAASSATVSGWACDPEWPGASVAVQIYGGAPREQAGTTLLGQVQADEPLSSPLLSEVSLACDGPGRTSARHGFSFTLPANQTGNVFVYAIDQATDDGPAAPPTLIRNGIVHVPTCAHGEHVTGDPLDGSCSTCAGAVCGDGTHASCCTTAWTDDCAAAADACESTDSSAPADSRVFAAATTGWIEAPADGSYLFDASAQPSRLFINGTKVLDWFSGSGTKQGNLTLMGGVRYALRWDRFQGTPPPGDSGPGVTWQPPGAVSLGPVPPGALYEAAPGSGTGLAATYFSGLLHAGTAVSRTDATVDINTDVSPPSPNPPHIAPPPTIPPKTAYSATWEGEIVPSFSEDYAFTVVGSGTATLTINSNPVGFPAAASTPVGAGCAHDLCVLGDKLAASTISDPACDPCVDQICANDPYCCNGGYLSYYSTEPTWDAKCVAEVKAYCAPEKCTTPLPSPVSPQKKSGTITLQAGVHYHLLLDYEDTSTTDPTIRLMWSSDRQAKQVVPQFALYPKGNPAAGLGAGLNVTYFATKIVSGVVQPDLDTVVGSGETADLSITAPVGPAGTPLVDAIAPPADVGAATPPPPAVVRPRYGDTVAVATSQLDVHGIGGLTGGAVHIKVAEDPGTDLIVPVAADGTFATNVSVSGSGTRVRTLQLTQRTYSGTTCLAPALCAESGLITWPVTVTDASPSGTPPVITSPIDLTTSPSPADLVLPVTGTGTPGTLTVADQGLTGASATPAALTVAKDGTIGGSISLTHGTPSDPNPGWHKLIFSQGGVAAPPVFVSVGINPPTVTFPRTGAQIDCSDSPPDPREFTSTGSVPYSAAQFGRLFVVEETGRLHVNQVTRGAPVVSAQPSADGTFAFNATVALGYGKHLLYFFQAPDPPANATQDELDTYFRAFASLANTPTSRVEVDVPPPQFQIPPGLALVDRGAGTTTNGSFLAPAPTQGSGLNLAITQCGPNVATPSVLCALPFADVNVRVGPRVFTARADVNGAWALSVPVPHSWNELTLSQVADSTVGGAWQEGCPSNGIGVGSPSPGAPALTGPGDLTFDATSPAGAVASYVVTATGVNGDPTTVDCEPASGSIFPVGRTAVLCTAIDTTTGAVGLSTFGVTVIDGPPSIAVPPGITAEATSALGALVSYDVTATDAVSGPLPVECAPASPAEFPLDIDTTVSCSATNAALETTTATFVVRVRDTTPPTLCPLPNIQVGTNAGAGATVTFATSASDLVDGSDPVSCDHPSGSFFPVGNTIVTCTATDHHGNPSPPSRFTVSVGDTAPPVLHLPADITATATSRLGARVSYLVTATDNVTPHPSVVCAPASGAQFPLGTTTVNCTATDASGNQSHGSFHVRVVVGWTGFLFPIANDGSSRFEQKLPLPVRFALVGASAAIHDLPARLFVAPLSASGLPGPERPAVKIFPGSGNAFDLVPIINQYLLLMDTRPQGIGAWQLRVDLGDGVVHTVRVTFTR